MKMKLGDKINDASIPLILYELTPPIGTSNNYDIQAYVTRAFDLFENASVKIDAVNIPEIRDEVSHHDESDLTKSFVPKMDVRQFAKLLQEASHNHLDVVINHGTVYKPLDKQTTWLKESIDDFDIKNVILVGGQSHKIQYPGPSVIEMCKLIKSNNNSSLSCGGITIQNRRCNELSRDEPHRMLEKAKSGIDFFTSQIIYDADIMTSLLKDYDTICREKNTTPKRIFLSFAPISTKSDIEFLRWLGVIIPKTIEEYIFKSDTGAGSRSIKTSLTVLKTILDFMQTNKITVPIGLNIEHINQHNFELTKEFIEQLGQLYIESY